MFRIIIWKWGFKITITSADIAKAMKATLHGVTDTQIQAVTNLLDALYLEYKAAK
jgi:hypothetical protein